MDEYEGLKPFATEKQWAYVEAVREHGSANKAAQHLPVDRRTIDKSLKRLKQAAALRGYAPDNDMVHRVPDSFMVKGVSTLYDKDGQVSAQWVKSQLNRQEYFDALKDVISDLADDIWGKFKSPSLPKTKPEDWLAVYPIGDAHNGMYAWGKETGSDDFDLDKAVAYSTTAMGLLVEQAPRTKTAIILNLGDFLHINGFDGKTPQSGHMLSQDSRWSKVLRTASGIMQSMVSMALQKHDHIIVRCNMGNHDPESSISLALILEAFYATDDRVTVDISPNPFWYYRFGKTLLGTTHGDRIKPAQLPGIMASDVPELWGQTSHRYFYIGHVHHTDVRQKEDGGAIVEAFRILPPRDDWHNRSGYRAGRDMKCIIHSPLDGEIFRRTVNISHVKRMINEN